MTLLPGERDAENPEISLIMYWALILCAQGLKPCNGNTLPAYRFPWIGFECHHYNCCEYDCSTQFSPSIVESGAAPDTEASTNLHPSISIHLASLHFEAHSGHSVYAENGGSAVGDQQSSIGGIRDLRLGDLQRFHLHEGISRPLSKDPGSMVFKIHRYRIEAPLAWWEQDAVRTRATQEVW